MATKNKTRHRKQVRSRGFESRFIPLFLILFFVILIPLLHFKTTIDPVLYPRFTAMAMGLLIFTLLFFVNVRRAQSNLVLPESRFFLFFVIFVVLNLFAMALAINPVESITALLRWILAGLLIYFTVTVLLNEKITINLVLKGVVISALIASIVGAYQFLESFQVIKGTDEIYEVKGLMAHKNQYAISLFLMLPFLASGIHRLKQGWKRFSLIALILNLVLIVALQTRSVWMALFLCLVLSIVLLGTIFRKYATSFLSGKLWRRGVAIASILIVVVLMVIFLAPAESPVAVFKDRALSVFDTQQTSNYWRLEMWDATLDMILDNPLTGVGPGNWIVSVYGYYGQYLPSIFRQWRHPHNDFLELASEAGIPALILYLCIIGYLLVRGYKGLMKTENRQYRWMLFWMINGIVGFLVISFFTFPVSRINQVIYLCLLAAMILVITRKKETENNKTPGYFSWLLIFSFLISGFSIYYGLINIRMEINIDKARIAHEQKQWTDLKTYAEKGYHPIAAIEPRFSFPVVMYKGLSAFHADKDLEKALSYFKKAHYQHPTNISVINNVGSVFGQMAEYDSSIVYAHKALDIFPHYEHALLNLSKALYMKGEYVGAYQNILSCDPQSENPEIAGFKRRVEKALQ